MAKGDKTRQQNKVDEQQKQGQTYLTGVQSQLGNQYGNMSTNYFGSGAPTTGSVYGVGTTVPQYNLFNQPTFSGNGTGTQYTGTGGNSSGAGGGNFGQAEFMQLTNGIPPTPQNLEALAPQLAQYGIKVHKNAAGVAGKIEYPNGMIVDVLAGAGIGGTGWQFDSGGGGGGGGGGLAGTGAGGMLNQNMADYGNIMSQYQDFAKTGGYSDQDKANIRARAISPIRSVYDRAKQEVERKKALQGGYSPGYATALGRFSREQGQLTSDATTNAEAAIAQMVQQGKLAGLGGMAGMYGATPGFSNMLGNQALAASGQQLTAAGLQNQLGLGLIQGQYQNAQIPNSFTSALQNIGQVAGAAGSIYPWLNPSTYGAGAGSASSASAGIPGSTTYGGYTDPSTWYNGPSWAPSGGESGGSDPAYIQWLNNPMYQNLTGTGSGGSRPPRNG